MAKLIKDMIFNKLGISINAEDLPSDEVSQNLITTTLLVMGFSDDNLCPDESAKIVEILKREFLLASDDAVKLYAETFKNQIENKDLEALITEVSSDISAQHKQKVVELLLEVMNADDRKSSEENQILQKVIGLFKLPEEAVVQAYENYHQNKNT